MTSSKKHVVTAVDWQKVRNRLAQTKAAMDEAHQLSPERARAVMDKRAIAIARVPSQAPAAGALLEVITFTLAHERYAIETRYVREVLRRKECTPLPGTPPFLLGIMNLRGQILAVLDLRMFFDMADQETSDLSRIIVLGDERVEFGVVADAVHEVTMLRIDELREPPGSVAGIAREYVRGVSADSLILLDGSILLKDSRLFIDLGDNGTNANPEVRT